MIEPPWDGFNVCHLAVMNPCKLLSQARIPCHAHSLPQMLRILQRVTDFWVGLDDRTNLGICHHHLSHHLWIVHKTFHQGIVHYLFHHCGVLKHLVMHVSQTATLRKSIRSSVKLSRLWCWPHSSPSCDLALRDSTSRVLLRLHKVNGVAVLIPYLCRRERLVVFEDLSRINESLFFNRDARLRCDESLQIFNGRIRCEVKLVWLARSPNACPENVNFHDSSTCFVAQPSIVGCFSQPIGFARRGQRWWVLGPASFEKRVTCAG
mmetsp:Transcript_21204/g.55299  ORF Transcript_21204/g.55299 Transcript_21204/m.55299 type:complete len:264 (-) Transcript_21204:71-862(-)